MPGSTISFKLQAVHYFQLILVSILDTVHNQFLMLL